MALFVCAHAEHLLFPLGPQLQAEPPYTSAAAPGLV